MAHATRSEVFDVDINNIYEVLLDYEKYPEFMTGVDKVTILDSSETESRVEYQINVIKKLNYIFKARTK